MTVGAPTAVAVGSQCITVRPVTVAYTNNFLFLAPIVGFDGHRGWRRHALQHNAHGNIVDA